ncbi:hypothetical protein J1N35_037673 [Gossypium stocksii]|uniref:Uncharacterized protein n=1 Tax=Gossypium stocksii TaxID=47602 RepID=A0A9D3UMF5_9ROSI|nr:hypothetical protein J1N35_037673 [Gossypium stocksii]
MFTKTALFCFHPFYPQFYTETPYFYPTKFPIIPKFSPNQNPNPSAIEDTDPTTCYALCCVAVAVTVSVALLYHNQSEEEESSEFHFFRLSSGNEAFPSTFSIIYYPDCLASIHIVSAESDGMRKTQGHMLLKDLYELNFVECVKVARNNLGQPVGSEARLLAGYLGIIARNANLLPINYESWHHKPNSNKNQALDNIKEKFALEVSDYYVKKALGKKWRDHKSALKKEYFKKNISLEEKLQNVLPGMLRIVTELEQQVGKNKNLTHTIGSKSFACVAKVELDQFFDITHRKKDGSPMTSEAVEIMEKLKNEKAEYVAIASSDSSVNLNKIDNRIITEVLGLESSQQYMPSGSQAQAEVQRLRDQMAQMQVNTFEQIAQLKAKAASREAEVQRKYKEFQLQLQAEAATREAEQSKKYDALQLQLQNMMKMFQQL